MSIVVAVKQNGRVYMGADSQSTSGSLAMHWLCESDYKIKRYDDGLLIGSVGSSCIGKILLNKKEIFTVPPEGLTKKYIVCEIIPKIYSFLEKKNLLKKEDDDTSYNMDCNLLLVYKDKMFNIGRYFTVIENARYCTIGAGDDYVFPYLDGFDYGVDANEQLLKAMKCSAKYDNSISGPYIFIDNEHLKYTIKEN